MTNDLFTETDLEQMKQLGISREEVRRQLAVFEKGPRRLSLQRPCTPSDGIVPLESLDQESLLALWEEAAAKGRLSAFVPASGAATRMFAFLQRIRNQLDRVTLERIAEKFSEKSSDRRDLQVFMESLNEFALFEPLAEVMQEAGISLRDQLNLGDYTEILNFLLEPQGLNYRLLPKGLIPFHRYADHSRTALEEHLVEAVHKVCDEEQRCRLHFTVTTEIQEEVKNHGLKAAANYGASSGVEY